MNVVRRVAVAAVVLPLVGVLGACGGGAQEESKAGAEGKPRAAAAAKKTQVKKDPGAKPLTEEQLEKAAVVEADLKGFMVEKLPASALDIQGLTASPESCQPVADMSTFTSDPAPKAVVGRSAGATSGASLGTSSSVALLAHQESDAKAVMSALRDAVEKCGSGFKADLTYKSVKPEPGRTYGDESVSYELMGELDGDKMPLHFTVVRSGSTIAAFYGLNFLNPGKGQVPPELMTAQLGKLEKVAD